ncbi:chloride channel protein [Rhodobacteraceae bacterium 2CG4]|uniref:Chloride channel protein n=1 Tax=Halovulum marinum TaxID=2662447 RepID=A0A6L5Z399_9RHOB|nr:chloride channel protein [Halovulum marinum]MSU90555.1 chloride channel protein [Halovulum marinum]
MSEVGDLLKRQFHRGVRRSSLALTAVRLHGLGAVQFWVVALLIGVAAGFGAVGFRLGIETLQERIYGATDVELASHLATLHWGWLVAIPIFGGLVVGIILNALTPDGRAHTVAHVIEGAALRDGRVDTRYGVASALAALVTLSTGGSTGREGPVVHFGATIATWVSKVIRADGLTGRDLMGCAVAAAVSASFNAPIAGALFALEVVLRHFAVHAFAPIVIASVAGAVVARLFVGDVTEFMLPVHVLNFYQELPAFMILGLICGLVGALMIWSLVVAEDLGDAVSHQLRVPGWARPAIAGALLGGIAVFFPHIIGVGYETTSRALTGGLDLRQVLLFAAVKVVAVSITVAGRMGGGVFSPSLMLGALTGLGFGYVATSIFPAISGTVSLYALAGTGAVAASVLGAPISTTLIIFEMTGDWQAGLAVMVAVSLSSALSTRLVAHSYFLTVIERHGRRLAAGPQDYLPATIRLGRLMTPLGEGGPGSMTQIQDLLEQGVWLTPEDTLESALPMLERSRAGYLPIGRPQEDGTPDLLGVVSHIDALKAYNRALCAIAREEHS